MEQQSVPDNLQSRTHVDAQDIDSIIDSVMLSLILDETASDSERQPISKPLSLAILVGQEDDHPHPRYLCFTYPFGTSSPKKHCKKCYCYVCEEIAPCKAWNKSPNKHCHATEKDEIWKAERERRKKVSPNITTTNHQYKLTISFSHYAPDRLVDGYGGGIICIKSGDWVCGFSMKAHNDREIFDSSVPPYIALIEGLELAWSRGFRCLEVELGFLYQEAFWVDFHKDTTSGKYRTRHDPTSPAYKRRTILKMVELKLDRQWSIDVTNSASVKNEAGALALAMMTSQNPLKQIYDFPWHPLTTTIKEMAKLCESGMKLFAPINPCDDVKTYCGHNT